METKTQNSVSEVISKLKGFSLDELKYIVIGKKNYIKNGNNEKIDSIQRIVNSLDKYEEAYFKKEFYTLLDNLGGSPDMIIIDISEKGFNIIQSVKNLNTDELLSFKKCRVDINETVNKEDFTNIAEDFNAFSYIQEGDTQEETDEDAIDRFGVSMSSCKKLAYICTSISELEDYDFKELITRMQTVISETKPK